MITERFDISKLDVFLVERHGQSPLECLATSVKTENVGEWSRYLWTKKKWEGIARPLEWFECAY